MKDSPVIAAVRRFLLLIALCLSGSAGFATEGRVGPKSTGTITSSTPSFWELPTGSRVAYRKFGSGGRRQLYPIVFLHGGPGAYALGFEPTARMLAELARSGRDVYAYDQVGGGFSERLTDSREYTVSRHIADLEAIREAIGAERVILFGSSWGATLAAHYTVEHPGHVAGMIVSGPGVMHPSDWKEGYGRVEDRMTVSDKASMRQFLEDQKQLEPAMEALASDPAEALRLLPDAEGGRIFDEVTNRFYLPHLGCPGTKLHVQSNGYGFWANRMTGTDLEKTTNPMARLRALTVPTLILRGSCEYMKPEVAEQYRDALKGRLVTIDGAGHMIWWEKPREFLSVVKGFLASLP